MSNARRTTFDVLRVLRDSDLRVRELYDAGRNSPDGAGAGFDLLRDPRRFPTSPSTPAPTAPTRVPAPTRGPRRGTGTQPQPQRQPSPLAGGAALFVSTDLLRSLGSLIQPDPIVLKASKSRAWRADNVLNWIAFTRNLVIGAVHLGLRFAADDPTGMHGFRVDRFEASMRMDMQKIDAVLSKNCRFYYFPDEPSTPRAESKTKVTRPGRIEPRNYPRLPSKVIG